MVAQEHGVRHVPGRRSDDRASTRHAGTDLSRLRSPTCPSAARASRADGRRTSRIPLAPVSSSPRNASRPPTSPPSPSAMRSTTPTPRSSPPLLPVLIEKFSLSNAQAGLLNVFLQWPSLLQPFIGYLADRRNLRILVVAAPAIAGVCMSLLGVAPSYAHAGVAAAHRGTGRGRACIRLARSSRPIARATRSAARWACGWSAAASGTLSDRS